MPRKVKILISETFLTPPTDTLRYLMIRNHTCNGSTHYGQCTFGTGWMFTSCHLNSWVQIYIFDPSRNMCMYVHWKVKIISQAHFFPSSMQQYIYLWKWVQSNLGGNVYCRILMFMMGNNTVMLEHAYHRQFLINVEIIKAVSKLAGLCLKMENIFFLL